MAANKLKSTNTRRTAKKSNSGGKKQATNEPAASNSGTSTSRKTKALEQRSNSSSGPKEPVLTAEEQRLFEHLLRRKKRDFDGEVGLLRAKESQRMLSEGERKRLGHLAKCLRNLPNMCKEEILRMRADSESSIINRSRRATPTGSDLSISNRMRELVGAIAMGLQPYREPRNRLKGEWLAEHEKPIQLLPLPARKLTLHEGVAILCAMHDAASEGEPLYVTPLIEEPLDGSDQLRKNWLDHIRAAEAYECLVSSAKEYKVGKNDPVYGLLAKVVHDLSNIGSGSGAKEPNDKTFSTAQLKVLFALENDAINKYAKRCGVSRPARGGKNFRNTHEDAVKLAHSILENAVHNRDRENAKLALEKLEAMSRLNPK
jgi:hypothetical protein